MQEVTMLTGLSSVKVIIIVLVAVVVTVAATTLVLSWLNKPKVTTQNSSTNTSPSSTSSPASSSSGTPACDTANLQVLAQAHYGGAYINQPLCADGFAIAEMNVPAQHLDGWVVYYQAQNGSWTYLKAAQMGNPCASTIMPSGFPVSLCNQWQSQNN